MLVAALTFNHNCAYGLALTDNRDAYLVARKRYFAETLKQTIQPRANSLSIISIYFILLSCSYSVMVSRLGIIPASFLQVLQMAWREWRRQS